jgi:hypothetical protein
MCFDLGQHKHLKTIGKRVACKIPLPCMVIMNYRIYSLHLAALCTDLLFYACIMLRNTARPAVEWVLLKACLTYTGLQRRGKHGPYGSIDNHP